MVSQGRHHLQSSCREGVERMIEDFHDLPASVRWALGVLLLLVVFKYSIIASFAFGFGFCTYLVREKLKNDASNIASSIKDTFTSSDKDEW